MRIQLFVPPAINPQKFNFNEFNSYMGKEYHYYSRGRHAIFHALQALSVTGTVVMPAYACPTIKQSILKASLKYICCDIDPDDMNISFYDFKRLYEANNDIECVIVPSLYGNPADLISFEKFCQEHSIKMIDDSAQSYGAELENRKLSTFGNAGLLAFSPGKNTPAPMGALLWTDRNYRIKRTRHRLTHIVIYKNYIINREGAYRSYHKLKRKVINILSQLAERTNDITNDQYERFELDKIGGVINAINDGTLSYRQYYYSKFVEKFFTNNYFRILKGKRGISCPSKIVLIANDKHIRTLLVEYLKEKQISIYTGYTIGNDGERATIAKEMALRIIELPIENNDERMKYLFKCIDYFIRKQDNEKEQLDVNI